MIKQVVCPEGHVDNVLLSHADQVFKMQGLLVESPEPEPIAEEQCEVCKGGTLLAQAMARFGTASGF